MTTIAITAGGTGGHVFPALAVAKVLQQQGHRLIWLGTAERIEADVVPAAGIDFHTLPQQGIRGRGLLGYGLAPFRIAANIVRARRWLQQHQVSLVIGFGGYTAGPAGVAARSLGLPLVIHEQNAVPGLTNKLLSRIASKTLVGFPQAALTLRNAHVVGNPVRSDIVELSQRTQEIRKESSKALNLLVVGGSLGAQVLNQVVPAMAANWTGAPLLIRHQVGKGRQQAVEQAYQQIKPDTAVQFEVFEFIDDMAAAYQQADLVICRAGALTVAEIASAGLASILVPYPAAVDDHQFKNAEYLASAEAAILIRQQQFSATWLAQQLMTLVQQPERLQQMAKRAHGLAQPDATNRIIEQCNEFLKERAVS